MNYYRRYCGDYIRKTSRLTLIEHGAYTLMLDYYYTEQSPLPLDHEEIYTMVRAMKPADRAAVDKILSKFFHRRQDGYHNNRADEELDKATPLIEAARENGRKGGRRKNPPDSPAGLPEDNPTGNPSGSKGGEPAGLPDGQHPPSSNHHPRSSKPQTPAATGSPRRPAAVAILLRNLEKDRGKASKITSIDPRVIAWAANGVTDDQLREAHSMAVADRELTGEKAPINAGFLDVFVAKVTNGRQAHSAVKRKPWYIDTWTALVEKGRELGIEQGEDEEAPYFRGRVLKAAGITPEQLRQAEADWR